MPQPGLFDGSAIAAESEKPTFFTDPEDEYEYEYANDTFFNRSHKLGKMSGNNEKNIINNPFVQVSNQGSNSDASSPWLNLSEKKIIRFGSGNNLNLGTAEPFLISNSNCSTEKNNHSNSRGYNMNNNVNLSKSINNSTSSSTCVSNLDDIKAIKNNSSEPVSATLLDSNSNKSEELYTFNEIYRLEFARRQLKIRSYYKAFKIFSFIAFLLFFPSILTIIMECSCTSSSNFCLPRFEIQTSGVVLTNDNLLDFSGTFKLKKLRNSGDDTEVKSKALSIIGSYFKTLSGMVLDSEFDDNVISDGLGKIFDSSSGVIYKFSHLGYCKEIEEKLEKSIECHSYPGFGIDVPSVLIKDLAYELSVREIESDPEEVSNVFISNYRELLENFKDPEYSNNQYFFVGYLSSVVSQIIGYLSFLQFLFDFVALILCITVSLNLKGKEMENKKDKWTVNDEKREVENNKSSDNGLIYKGLFVSNLLLFLSTTVKVGSIIYEVFYLNQFAKNYQWGLIVGIRLISSGTVIDMINIVTHLFVMISISFAFLTKPWIVKIII